MVVTFNYITLKINKLNQLGMKYKKNLVYIVFILEYLIKNKIIFQGVFIHF